MKLDLTLAAAALLATGVNGLNLKAEHAGGVINRVHGGKFLSDDGVINDGTPSGKDVSIGNGIILCAILHWYMSNTRRNWIRHVPSSPSGKGCHSLPDRYLWQRAGQQQTVSKDLNHNL